MATTRFLISGELPLKISCPCTIGMQCCKLKAPLSFWLDTVYWNISFSPLMSDSSPPSLRLYRMKGEVLSTDDCGHTRWFYFFSESLLGYYVCGGVIINMTVETSVLFRVFVPRTDMATWFNSAVTAKYNTNTSCPVPDCDGSGHITGRYSFHRARSGCPLMAGRKSIDEIPVDAAWTAGLPDIRSRTLAASEHQGWVWQMMAICRCSHKFYINYGLRIYVMYR